MATKTQSRYSILLREKRKLAKFKEVLKKAFFIDKSEFVPTKTQKIIVDKIAQRIMKHGMGTVAILFLESFKPLNYVTSQLLVFFEPILKGTLFGEEYSEFYRMLEHRGSINYILERIEFYMKSLGQKRSVEQKGDSDDGEKS